MKPSTAIHQKGEAIRETTQRFRVANPRIFGSVLHGTDVAGSDLDVLVDPLPGPHCLTSAACRSRWKNC